MNETDDDDEYVKNEACFIHTGHVVRCVSAQTQRQRTLRLFRVAETQRTTPSSVKLASRGERNYRIGCGVSGGDETVIGRHEEGAHVGVHGTEDDAVVLRRLQRLLHEVTVDAVRAVQRVVTARGATATAVRPATERGVGGVDGAWLLWRWEGVLLGVGGAASEK